MFVGVGSAEDCGSDDLWLSFMDRHQSLTLRSTERHGNSTERPPMVNIGMLGRGCLWAISRSGTGELVVVLERTRSRVTDLKQAVAELVREVEEFEPGARVRCRSVVDAVGFVGSGLKTEDGLVRDLNRFELEKAVFVLWIGSCEVFFACGEPVPVDFASGSHLTVVDVDSDDT